MIYGLCFPTWLDYITFTETTKIGSTSRLNAIKYMIMNYGFCAFVFIAPTIWLRLRPPTDGKNSD